MFSNLHFYLIELSGVGLISFCILMRYYRVALSEKGFVLLPSDVTDGRHLRSNKRKVDVPVKVKDNVCFLIRICN